MSINHYSPDIQEGTLWWSSEQHHRHHLHQNFLMQATQNPSPPPSWPSHLYPPPPPPARFNLNHHDIDDYEEDEDERSLHVENKGAISEGKSGGGGGRGEEEKEGMFEKPLTPSDVGKLNRLVIPKQHAEKYFPLAAAAGGEVAGESKGVSLSFEDEEGKCWRFRYSYWNSSQSYVLTKGWSRYVKDKRLDAGDVVLFLRHRTHSNRLFINWRRRLPATRAVPSSATDGDSNMNNNNVGVGVGWTRSFYAPHPYPTHHHHQALPYQPHCLHAGLEEEQNKTTSPAGNNSSSRILRLFGVDMECQPQDSGPQCSYMSSTTSFQDTAAHQHHHLYGHFTPQSASNYSSNHMVRQQP